MDWVSDHQWKWVRAGCRWQRFHKVPSHGALVRYSPGTNVNTPFSFQVPTLEFGHQHVSHAQDQDLVLGPCVHTIFVSSGQSTALYLVLNSCLKMAHRHISGTQSVNTTTFCAGTQALVPERQVWTAAVITHENRIFVYSLPRRLVTLVTQAPRTSACEATTCKSSYRNRAREPRYSLPVKIAWADFLTEILSATFQTLLIKQTCLQVISSAIEVLNHCDKISSCTPLVKWTEPIHVAVSSIQESCLLFISSNFFSLIDETGFHEVLKVNYHLYFFLVVKQACRVGFPGANPGGKEAAAGGGGEGLLNKVLFGEAPPRGPKPYPLYTIFERKGTTFVYLLLTSDTRTLHLFFTIIKSFGSFYGLKWQISLAFHRLQLIQISALYLPETWKRFPLLAVCPSDVLCVAFGFGKVSLLVGLCFGRTWSGSDRRLPEATRCTRARKISVTRHKFHWYNALLLCLGYIVHEFVQAASTISDFIRLFNILVLFIFQGVGWSIPVLEKILSAVKKQLAIDNCCDQLRAILKLKRLLHLRNIEEDKESFPEVRSVFCTARRRRKKQKKLMHVCSF